VSGAEPLLHASVPGEQRYRVVETSDVTDVELTRILNEMTADGWRLDGIHFAMREASRRPSMAFVVFCRPAAAATD
jgi:hypothetical protein